MSTPTLAEVMADVARMESAETQLERDVARGLIAVKVGRLLGMTPEESFEATRPAPKLALVRSVELPWVEEQS